MYCYGMVGSVDKGLLLEHGERKEYSKNQRGRMLLLQR